MKQITRVQNAIYILLFIAVLGLAYNYSKNYKNPDVYEYKYSKEGEAKMRKEYIRTYYK